MAIVTIEVFFPGHSPPLVKVRTIGDLTPRRWINALARIERTAHELAINTAGVAGLSPVDVGHLMTEAFAAALSEPLPTAVRTFEEAHG